MQVDPAGDSVVDVLGIPICGFAIRRGNSDRWQLMHIVSAAAPATRTDLDERLSLDDA